MEDVTSTGRKRAAVAAPLDRDAPCEWAYLAKAGGGVVPIVGCLGNNKQTDRHHGPDKSTLNNEVGVNLHRICSMCHNRWHAANDEFYGERPPAGEPFVPKDREILPHDPETRATPEDFQQAALFWATRPTERKKLDG